MRMEITQSLKHELQQKLTPQLLQSIKILQLSSIDLEQYIKGELEKNPTLEMTENKPNSEDQPVQQEETSDDNREEPIGDLENDFSQLESLSDAYGDYFPGSRTRYNSSEGDRKLEALNNTAAPPVSLQDHLVQQLHLMDVSDKLIQVGEEIIYNLDGDGYFPYELSDIIDCLRQDGLEVSDEEAQEALEIVQSLDPPGVGGRNMKECLLIQLRQCQNYEFEQMLVEKHMEDIEKNRLPKIVKDTGEDMEIIKEAVDLIRNLHPKPGSLFRHTEIQYIQPDVVVEEVEGEFEITIEDSTIPSIYISNRYRRMLEEKGDDPQVRKFVKKKIESAKWLIESLQQRKNTMERISRAIVDHQEEFLRKGVSALQPLTMQEIADKLEIHVSTVSRAISGKYMQTPQGILDMSFFFTGGKDDAEGETHSTLSIKEMILNIVKEEDKKHPLSDDQIAEKLKRQDGIKVARRTITKYRKQLHIPSSRQRKEY